MRYTVTFAVILYAISAMIDAFQGITTLNATISYTFRIASATAITATAIHILNRNRPLRALPFILTSLALSITALLLGHTTPTTLTNTAMKITATILTPKPEIMKIELMTEDMEESNRST